MNNTVENRCCKNCKEPLTSENTEKYAGQIRHLIFCDRCQKKILDFLKCANRSKNSADAFFKKNAEKLNANGIEPDGLRYVYAFCHKLDEHKAGRLIQDNFSTDMPEVDEDMMAAITALTKAGIEIYNEPAPEQQDASEEPEHSNAEEAVINEFVREPEEDSIPMAMETAEISGVESESSECDEPKTEVEDTEDTMESTAIETVQKAGECVLNEIEAASSFKDAAADIKSEPKIEDKSETLDELENSVSGDKLDIIDAEPVSSSENIAKKKFVIFAAAAVLLFIIIVATIIAFGSGNKDTSIEDGEHISGELHNQFLNNVYENFTYSVLDDGGIKLLSYTSSDANEKIISIPAEINGAPIEVLADGIFKSNLKLEKVIIPENVREIGAYAFSGCSSLNSIDLPQSLEVIGDDAFSGCFKLTDITIPDGVSHIGAYALNDTAWQASRKDEFLIVGNGQLIAYQGGNESIVLPDGVKKICGGAFAYNKNIKSVELESGVESIENRAFEYCEMLEEILIPDTIVYIGENAFPKNEQFVMTAPESTYIEDYALKNGINLNKQAE